MDVGVMLGAVNRSDVLRMAIFKGVVALEAELPPAHPEPDQGPQEGPGRPSKAHQERAEGRAEGREGILKARPARPACRASGPV